MSCFNRRPGMISRASRPLKADNFRLITDNCYFPHHLGKKDLDELYK